MRIALHQAARRCAQVLNIQTQGTLGLVVVAKQQGLVPAVRPVLEQLAGMFMSDRLEDQVLAAAGEPP
jgi:predicted nucleic acid-binding protein